MPVSSPATGLLIGSQYYRTFDGKFYHFEGKCQYLLASDFVDKNFTVVVDYDAQSQASVQKSLIVTDQKDTISLQPDHTVSLKVYEALLTFLYLLYTKI
jgi:hypothetical protein